MCQKMTIVNSGIGEIKTCNLNFSHNIDKCTHTRTTHRCNYRGTRRATKAHENTGSAKAPTFQPTSAIIGREGSATLGSL